MNKYILITCLIIPNIGNAESFNKNRVFNTTNNNNENLATYTKEVSLIGCYKMNNSDLCVDDTYIKCSNDIEKNYQKWGSVVASFCDDQNYYKNKVKFLQRKLSQFLTNKRKK